MFSAQVGINKQIYKVFEFFIHTGRERGGHIAIMNVYTHINLEEDCESTH